MSLLAPSRSSSNSRTFAKPSAACRRVKIATICSGNGFAFAPLRTPLGEHHPDTIWPRRRKSSAARPVCSPAPCSHAGSFALRSRLDGASGPEYWLTTQNFFVISRYNRSPLYSMAVHQLAAAIAAGLAEPKS